MRGHGLGCRFRCGLGFRIQGLEMRVYGFEAVLSGVHIPKSATYGDTSLIRNCPLPLGPPKDPRHSLTLGS